MMKVDVFQKDLDIIANFAKQSKCPGAFVQRQRLRCSPPWQRRAWGCKIPPP